MNNGYSQLNGAMLNGLLDISANTVVTAVMDTSQIILNGVDVSAQLNQVPINTSNIINLQQITTGITYNTTGDLTTIDNNVTVGAKNLKCSYSTTANDDVANKLYVDTKITNLINGAGPALDTLNELASALNNDASFSTTVTNAIAGKQASGTITTSNMPVSGTFYPIFTNSSTGASNLAPSSIDQISYDRNNNRITVPNLNTFGQLTMTSTDNTMRQIWSTFYNFMDTSAAAGGVNVGRIYANDLSNYYNMYNPLATFTLLFGSPPTTPYTMPFQVTSTQATFSNPPICSVNCSTSTQLANKAYVDSVSSKLTTTLLPTTGTYYLPFLTSSVAGSGLTAYSDGNISYDRTNNRLNVPNLYSYGVADFLNSPTCSIAPTTANHLVNKTYCDNASSNSPVGTIIMYGSNTIPPGWLLCNGSNVSKITYSDLWNVIGDTFMFVPPPTGFFTLPNLVGQYPRGAGTNSTLSVTKTTTLGQTIAGQVGKHAHVSAFMNSDTQGTTTTKTVVSSVTGAGLVTNTTSVSAPLVTTTATNGTTQSSIDAYKPYPTILTDETFPNSVSVNYIIKFQTSATPTPLSTPTFTQTSSVLTIQNNSPISGIINFTLNNASSVAQTPLSLSSTDIIVSLPISCATAPTIANHLVNKNYVDNLVAGGVSLTTTDQTITGVKTFSSDLITSARVFGRNDGYAFNTISTTASSLNLYPIGYCFEIIGTTTLPVNLTDKTENVSIALTNGVWILSGFVVLNKGNGTYLVSTKLSALWNVGIAGIKLFPNAAGAVVSIASTSTVAQHIISLGSVNVVVTTAGAIQTMTRNLAMTCGTTTSWSISFSGVKIA